SATREQDREIKTDLLLVGVQLHSGRDVGNRLTVATRSKRRCAENGLHCGKVQLYRQSCFVLDDRVLYLSLLYEDRPYIVMGFGKGRLDLKRLLILLSSVLESSGLHQHIPKVIVRRPRLRIF